jgi:hypothetical protein
MKTESCKIGTVPMVIWQRDRRTPLKVGRIIRIKEHQGGKWSTVKVTRIDDGGYFMADRI